MHLGELLGQMKATGERAKAGGTGKNQSQTSKQSTTAKSLTDLGGGGLLEPRGFVLTDPEVGEFRNGRSVRRFPARFPLPPFRHVAQDLAALETKAVEIRATANLTPAGISERQAAHVDRSRRSGRRARQRAGVRPALAA